MPAGGLPLSQVSATLYSHLVKGYFHDWAPRPSPQNQHQGLRVTCSQGHKEEGVLITGEVLCTSKKGGARIVCLRAKDGVLQCGENTGPAASEERLPLDARTSRDSRHPTKGPWQGQWKGVSRFANGAEFTLRLG